MENITTDGEIWLEGDFQAKMQKLRQLCEKVNNGYKKLANKMLPALLSVFFNEVYEYVEKLAQDNFSDPLKETELEKWLIVMEPEKLLNRDCSSYSMHPVALMNRWYKDIALEKNKEKCMGNHVAKNIGDAIILSKVQNRSKMNFRIYEKDYKVSIDEKKVKPYEEYGSITKIQDIRIITKVENLLRGKRTNAVKIAVFGELEPVGSHFNEYFKGKSIQIERFLYLDEDIFCGESSQKTINLKDSEHLHFILTQYDLILFLDESYFYRKGQSHKSFWEENYVRYMRILHQKVEEGDTDEIQKINLYYTIYETARKILACREFNMSPQYEFDERLIKRVESISSNCAEDVGDVYFYINGERLADKNIELLNVCKEENYDGINLTVYKVHGNADIKENENIFHKTENIKTITVDLWKLIKSISNLYYVEHWGQYAIRELMTINIVFKIRALDKNDLTIQYTIESNGNVDLLQKTEEFMKSFLGLISAKNGIVCIKHYLINLLSDALLSRANSVECTLMAYWIPQKENLHFEYVIRDNWELSEEDSGTTISYRERKQVYTIINRLNRLLIRDMEQLERILLMDFKVSYANDMSDWQFIECIKEIHSVCERLGETDSRLYIYTNIS